jgi:iron complex transport system substrate-binding protein
MAEDVEKTLGIPVVVLTYGEFATFDEAVLDSIRVAGKVLGQEERAGEVIAFVNGLRADLMRRGASVPEEKRSGVYVGGIGYRGAYGIESTEHRYIPFDWVGAKNVAETVPASVGSHVFMDKEMLLRLDPEVIFIDGGGLALTREDFRKKTEYYRALSAFDARRVYILHPFNWYTTNIGTALSDAYTIGKILYPDTYVDVDAEKKADEIYTFLVGAPVYRKMKADYGQIGQVAPFIK